MTGPAAGPGAPGPVGVGVSQLGPAWVPGPDGVPFRRGARLVLLDRADRVLMVQGHDVDQPERHWWFTPGGGIDPGESSVEAAVRELREERLLRDLGERIRDVAVGPDGAVYAITDEDDGEIWRIAPAE